MLGEQLTYLGGCRIKSRLKTGGPKQTKVSTARLPDSGLELLKGDN